MQRITNIVHQTSELIRLTNTLIHFYKQAQLDLNKLFQAIWYVDHSCMIFRRFCLFDSKRTLFVHGGCIGRSQRFAEFRKKFKFHVEFFSSFLWFTNLPNTPTNACGVEKKRFYYLPPTLSGTDVHGSRNVHYYVVHSLGGATVSMPFPHDPILREPVGPSLNATVWFLHTIVRFLSRLTCFAIYIRS